MTNDNSDDPNMQYFESAPNNQSISHRVSLWTAQKTELAAMISPTMDYKRLAWNILFGIGARGSNEQLMLQKECAVAQRIVDWLDDHPQHGYYRDLIKEIPYRDYLELESTSTLHFNLWRMTDASLWLSTREAANHRDHLWQMAVVRTSAYLNTGSFVPDGGR